MNKLILLISILAFPAEWNSYRVIITNTVEAGGVESKSTCVVACKKTGNGKLLIRTTQTEPEKGRFVAISNDNKRKVLYPETNTLLETEESFQEHGNSALDKFVNTLFEKGVNNRIIANKKLSYEESLLLDSDSVMAVHVENSDGISDSLLFFKSNLPATKVFFRRGYVGNTQKVLMPLFLEITNLSPIVKTSIEYNGYRINCEIPDETFDKRCLDE